MICKKCGTNSETVDSETGLCSNCVDKDFFEWLEKNKSEE